MANDSVTNIGESPEKQSYPEVSHMTYLDSLLRDTDPLNDEAKGCHHVSLVGGYVDAIFELAGAIADRDFKLAKASEYTHEVWWRLYSSSKVDRLPTLSGLTISDSLRTVEGFGGNFLAARIQNSPKSQFN